MIRQETQHYRDSGVYQRRFDSPQSESISYSIPAPVSHEEEPVRVEETWFKPIQRDRSHDSLLQSPSSRSNIRTLSAGPRTMEITSLSPQNQVTFGKYTPNEMIAIVRVPELSNGAGIRVNSPSQVNISSSSTIRHGISEPELSIRAKQEEERAKLHYQRVHATSYRPPAGSQDDQVRQSRSRAGKCHALRASNVRCASIFSFQSAQVGVFLTCATLFVGASKEKHWSLILAASASTNDVLFTAFEQKTTCFLCLTNVNSLSRTI